jgi:hypothetical protein
MSFIGNKPDSFGYSSTSYDHFSGTGSQTVYTLTRSVSANADIFVTVNNVPQDPGVAYYVTDLNTLTFTSAPSSVANNIVIVYRNFVQTGLALGANTVTSFTIAPGAVQAYQISSVSNTSISGLITSTQLAPGAGGNPTANNLSNTAGNTIITSANTITMNAVSGIIDASISTGAFNIPQGTLAQRPANPSLGALRYNTTNNVTEIWSGYVWTGVTSQIYTVNYLVVAGGAGGGFNDGGGGGAGGMITGTSTITGGTPYTITIGAGGGFGGSNGDKGASGTSSSFNAVTPVGGGGGGSYATQNGNSGGSGGGACGNNGAASGGSGTSGQGNNGGNTSGGGGGAGGGGAGAAGGSGSGSSSGGGGVGTTSSISGSSVYYAGGGGGGSSSGGSGGGTGGGGAGGANGNASTNTGGGGGGGQNITSAVNGGNGGSGLVIISYTGAQRGTGGTVTSSGGSTIHTFTSSGTYLA